MLPTYIYIFSRIFEASFVILENRMIESMRTITFMRNVWKLPTLSHIKIQRKEKDLTDSFSIYNTRKEKHKKKKASKKIKILVIIRFG